ncbi:hypothetical protein [Mangrovibrevibacter kandeliae]|uniref:hypothetical protein n=1 Tax=Mangrovibrevibacter kandeliae TaxID=2968473 RepID=UPI0021177BAE|nr:MULTISPECIES: hypothetical protein [unclassified Aurantimonas]MCQ8781041.1 hypothetical protein [Aurantimonas sp. CSK15Z-1]MCW4113823.1 hypothetical protein [Aurantimonas sp. MSK8Z-1]
MRALFLLPLVLIGTAPAIAQTRVPATQKVAPTDPALPGVGTATQPDTETDAARGPGGLQNGVGAVGTLAPDTSSSNPVPFEPTSDGDSGIGVPISEPPAPVR